MSNRIQWNGDGLSMVEVAALAEGIARKIVPCNVFGKLCLEIQVGGPDLVAEPGDWVVKTDGKLTIER